MLDVQYVDYMTVNLQASLLPLMWYWSAVFPDGLCLCKHLDSHTIFSRVGGSQPDRLLMLWWKTRLLAAGQPAYMGRGWGLCLEVTLETALITFPWELMIYNAMQICLAVFNCSVFNSMPAPVFSNTWKVKYFFVAIHFKMPLYSINAKIFPLENLLIGFAFAYGVNLDNILLWI